MYIRSLATFVFAAGALVACGDDPAPITCPAGTSGADCAECATGYQDNDADGSCLPTCETLAAQGAACAHGTCSDDDGWPACACEPGFGGALCASCDPGQQDNDNNGSCVATCATAEALGFGCANGTCSDANGTPTCTCDANFGGPLCDRCGPNAIEDGAGGCLPLVATCAELKAAVSTAADGTYTLYIDHDRARPWTAYCHDMATTPREYLPLLLQGGNYNFSQYTTGGGSAGSNVRTSYTRVRIDPTTLVVDIGDQTFATSSGQLYHSGVDVVTSMPFGVAMSCTGNADGSANIDLTGTPFRIVEEFCRSQNLGGVTLSADAKVASITGGGFCGWTSPQDGAGCLFNPFNMVGGSSLALAYGDP